MKNKNIVLYIGRQESFKILNAIKANPSFQKLGFKIALIAHSKIKKEEVAPKGIDYYLTCDFTKPLKIMRALQEIQDNLAAVSCRIEPELRFFSKIVPHVPYLRTPSSESLLWCTNKVIMRQRLSVYNKNITPNFTVVKNASQEAIKQIEEKIKFPLVLKPSGLAASLLVSVCYHREDLARNLRILSRKINKIYRESNNLEVPQILAEEMMEGEMYSVDAYVDACGKVYFCPMVYVRTGRTIGFDDFFGYSRITPTKLTPENTKSAQLVAKDSIHALALRSTTAHIELMRTDKGWKVIELSPRIGGYRRTMYKLSFGIEHDINDILIRLPQKPIIPKKIKGYTACLEFFAREEGILKEIKGLNKIKKLESFNSLLQNKQIGDKCLYAKHGGKNVVSLTLFNKDRAELMADIRRAEQSLEIKTSKK